MTLFQHFIAISILISYKTKEDEDDYYKEEDIWRPHSVLLKFEYFEKATKFEKIFHLKFDATKGHSRYDSSA